MMDRRKIMPLEKNVIHAEDDAVEIVPQKDIIDEYGTDWATNPDLFEEEDAPDFSRQEFDWDTGRFLPEGGASNG